MDDERLKAFATTVRRAAVTVRVLVVLVALAVMADGVMALADPAGPRGSHLLSPGLRLVLIVAMPLVIGFGSVLWSMQFAMSQDPAAPRHAHAMLTTGLVCFALGLPAVGLLMSAADRSMGHQALGSPSGTMRDPPPACSVGRSSRRETSTWFGRDSTDETALATSSGCRLRNPA